MDTNSRDRVEGKTHYAVVLEDDDTLAAALVRVVASLGYDVDSAGTIGRARELIAAREPAIMLVDVTLPDGDGLEFMAELQAALRMNFVVITGDASQQVAVKCIRARAFDMLPKPIGVDDLKRAVIRAVEAHENSVLDGELTTAEMTVRADLSTIGVGDADSSELLRTQIRQAASTGNNAALIEGDPGTEKNAVAEAIHASAKRTGRLIMINCAAEVDEAASNRFFGRAARDGQYPLTGYLEQADGGTILLDDVTALPIALQASLLQFLDEKQFRRMEGTESVRADVFVSAIFREDPKLALSEGRLRRDFHDRLAKFTVKVPSLVDRHPDILSIAEHLLREINDRNGTAKVLTEAAKTTIVEHSWPGNVRELKNVLHRAALESDATTQLDIRDLDDMSMANPGEAPISDFVGKTFWQIEKELLYATLDHNDGDKETTARMLGISLKTLYNRLHAYS